VDFGNREALSPTSRLSENNPEVPNRLGA
jgi:hypothetical protein